MLSEEAYVDYLLSTRGALPSKWRFVDRARHYTWGILDLLFKQGRGFVVVDAKKGRATVYGIRKTAEYAIQLRPLLGRVVPCVIAYEIPPRVAQIARELDTSFLTLAISPESLEIPTRRQRARIEPIGPLPDMDSLLARLAKDPAYRLDRLASGRVLIFHQGRKVGGVLTTGARHAYIASKAISDVRIRDRLLELGFQPRGNAQDYDHIWYQIACNDATAFLRGLVLIQG